MRRHHESGDVEHLKLAVSTGAVLVSGLRTMNRVAPSPQSVSAKESLNCLDRQIKPSKPSEWS